MAREKAPDEIFCRSCGEPIKAEAEICPECGVRNQAQTSSTSTRPTTEHDPSQYETTVSENWYYGVAAALVLWIVALALSDAGGGAVETLIGFAGVIAWILMPLATYFDSKYVRANSRWNPGIAWVVAAVIPLLNLVSGAVYLYRRHEAVGVP